MPKKKTGPNRSAFIRSLPATLSVAEVVAQAKAAGMAISPTLVYVVRGKQAKRVKGGKPDKVSKTAQAARASTSAQASSAPRARSKAAGGKLTASEFIRSQPITLTAAAVIKAGAAQGLSFSAPLVYMARKRMQTGGAKPARAKAARNGSSDPGPTDLKGNQAEFRRLMLALGLEKAEAVYAVVHKELKAMAGTR